MRVQGNFFIFNHFVKKKTQMKNAWCESNKLNYFCKYELKVFLTVTMHMCSFAQHVNEGKHLWFNLGEGYLI